MNADKANKSHLIVIEQADDNCTEEEYVDPDKHLWFCEENHFYNQAKAFADYAYWGSIDSWKLDEAVALSFGRDPRIVKWKDVFAFTIVDRNFARPYKQRRTLVHRAFWDYGHSKPIPSADFLRWARTKKIEMPVELLKQFIAHGGVLDYSLSEDINTNTNINPAWQDIAREIADKLFNTDTTSCTRDSLSGYAKRVIIELTARNIKNIRGIVIDNANTVKREALQGGKWWGNKIK